MRHLFRFRTSHKRYVVRELLKKIIDGQFLICRTQHPLAQRTEVMRKFCEAEFMRTHGTKKIFPVYGSLTADPGAKALTSM